MASGHIKKKRKWLVVRGSFGKQCENNIFREYLLFGAGTKGLVYVANQELPRQTFNKEAVHSITQDYNSIKTKIIKYVSD